MELAKEKNKRPRNKSYKREIRHTLQNTHKENLKLLKTINEGLRLLG